MKKQAKRFVSAVLLLAMLLSTVIVVPTSAQINTPMPDATSDYTSGVYMVCRTVDKNGNPTDHALYAKDQEVIFEIKAFGPNKTPLIPPYDIKYTVKKDGSYGAGDESGIASFDPETGIAYVKTTTMSDPGYLYLMADIADENGNINQAYRPARNTPLLQGGVLVDAKNITTYAENIPAADMQSVWDAELAKQCEANLIRVEKLTTVNASYVSTHDTYAIYVDSVGYDKDITRPEGYTGEYGGQTGDTFAVAYMTVPKDKSKGTLDITFELRGYSIAAPYASYNKNAIVISPCAHSLELPDLDSTFKFYTYYSWVLGTSDYGFDYGDLTTNANIETCYFRNMLLRNYNIIRFALKAFDAEGAGALLSAKYDDTHIRAMSKDELTVEAEYWKGLLKPKSERNILVNGGSQGGFQAIGAAALCPEVTECKSSITWLADVRGGGSLSGNTEQTNNIPSVFRPNPSVAEGETRSALEYCDSANLAQLVKCKTTLTMIAMGDLTSPVSGVMAMYNNFPHGDGNGPYSVKFVQNRDHGMPAIYGDPWTAGSSAEHIANYSYTEISGDFDGRLDDATVQGKLLIINGTGIIDASIAADALSLAGDIANVDTVVFGEGFIGIEENAFDFGSSSMNIQFPTTMKAVSKEAFGNKSISSYTFIGDESTYAQSYAVLVGAAFSSETVDLRAEPNADEWFVAYDPTLTIVDNKNNTDPSDDVTYTNIGGFPEANQYANGNNATFFLRSQISEVNNEGWYQLTSGAWNFTHEKIASFDQVRTYFNPAEKKIVFEGHWGNAEVLDFGRCDSDVQKLFEKLVEGTETEKGFEVTTVEIHRLNGINVTDGKDASSVFTYFPKLKTVKLSEKAVTVGTNAFKDCKNITVEFPEALPSSLTFEDGAFADAENIYIPVSSIDSEVTLKALIGNLINVKVEYVDPREEPNPDDWFIAYDPNFKIESNGTVALQGGFDVSPFATNNVGKSSSARADINQVGWYQLTYSSWSTATNPKLAKFPNTRTYFNPASETIVFYSDWGNTALNAAEISAEVKAMLEKLVYGTDTTKGFKVTNIEFYQLTGTTAITSSSVASAFSYFPDLKTIKIDSKCTSFGANSFNGLQDVTVDMSAVDISKLTADANVFSDVKNIKIIAPAGKTDTLKALIGDNEEIKYVQNYAGENPLSFDALQVRINSYTGLRALFNFNQTAKDAADFTRMGVLAISGSYYASAYQSPEAVLEKIGTDPRIAHKLVYSTVDGEEYTEKYTKADGTQFCISLTKIPETNYVDGKVVFIAYAEIGGNLFTATNADSDYGEYSLYEVTLGLFKQGNINSKNCFEPCLWSVLKEGAYTIASSDISDPSGAVTSYTTDANGDFKYLDVDVHDWKENTANTAAIGVNPALTTNTVWSLLADGDSYVAVYRKKDTSLDYATIPGIEKGDEQYKYAALPFSDKYFANVSSYYSANGKNLYSPVLPAAEAAKVKTVIVDYGITVFDGGAFQAYSITTDTANAAYEHMKIETFVYPEGVTAGATLFTYQLKLKNVIYASKTKTEYDIPSLSDVIDLSGLKSLELTRTFRQSMTDYIILPTTTVIPAGKLDRTFFGLDTVKGISIASDPADGVVDLSMLEFTTVTPYTFHNLRMITKMILPESFDTIEATASDKYVFGNGSYEIVVQSKEAYNSIVNYYNSIKASSTTMNNITLTFGDLTGSITTAVVIE